MQIGNSTGIKFGSIAGDNLEAAYDKCLEKTNKPIQEITLEDKIPVYLELIKKDENGESAIDTFAKNASNPLDPKDDRITFNYKSDLKYIIKRFTDAMNTLQNLYDNNHKKIGNKMVE